MKATLTGEPNAPVLELEQFGFNARTPDGRLLREAVKELPGTRWNGKSKQWIVTGTGLHTDPYAVMEAHGFDIDDSVLDTAPWADVEDLADLTVPAVEIERADGRPVEMLVYPRLASFNQVRDHIGESAVPDKKLNCFRLPLPDALDQDLQPIPAMSRRLTGRDLSFAQDLFNNPPTAAAEHDDVDAAAAWLGANTCTEPYDANDPTWAPVLSAEAAAKIETIAAHTGHLPTQFGLNLFPFQLGGAYAVAAGHNVLVDPPGLGKGQRLDAPVMTPTGIATYRDLAVGSQVIGSDGKPTEVTAIFDRGILPTWEIVLSDGSTHVVDGDHLWTIDGVTVETRELEVHLDGGRIAALPMLSAPAELDGPWPGARPHALAEMIGGDVELDPAWAFRSVGVRRTLLTAALQRCGREEYGQLVLEVPAHQRAFIRTLIGSLGGVWEGERTVGLPDPELVPATLRRRLSPGALTPLLHIVAARPTGRSAEIRCISVAAADALYAIDGFVLTHNTRQTLAAAAIRGDKRILLVCPKLAVSNWVREASGAFSAGENGTALLDTAGVAWAPSAARIKPNSKPKPVETFTAIQPGRNVPLFPEEGVVVIAHSTLAARPELTEELISWAPTFVGWDEAHLISNWETQAALASRKIATALQGRAMCVPITGTPVRSSVVELANLLYFSGHLQPYFDGPASFLATYAKRNHFGAWVTKKRPTGLLESLHAKLADTAWVRRDKAAVLPQLPEKLRAVQLVNTPTRAFKEAHDRLFEIIEEWIDELGHEPNDTEIDEYAAASIGLVTPLRVAAGEAKADVVAEIVKDWMESHEQPKDGPYDDPLILWFVYTDVMYEVGAKVEELGYQVAYIDGQTESADRGGAQDLMQAGKLGVLLSTIKAGGQNLTLTRCRQAFMVETDWVPANVTQAEDRIHRISQDRQATITTLLNVETLDPVVRAVQLRKAEILERVMPGGDHRVGGFNTMIGDDGTVTQITEQELTKMEAVASPADILARIVEDVVATRARRTHGR